MMHSKNSIPEHIEGTEVTVEDSITLPGEEKAKAFFLLAKERLLDINNWSNIAGSLSAVFQLTNEKGKEINTVPKKGHYFKINIHAPAIISGDGYDWVQVEEVMISDKDEMVSIRVRPASSPLNSNEDVAHFYSDKATSNFVVKREGNKVIAGVYGRNEKPNIESENLVDRIRNAIVGSGAVMGIAKLQWKALVNGLLDQKD